MVTDALRSRRLKIGLAGIGVTVVVIGIVLWSVGLLSAILALFTVAYASSAMRLTAPIAFAALGGIFAEKTGVINIGLEGLMIVSAFVSIAALNSFTSGGMDPSSARWLALVIAVSSSTVLAGIFALVCIRYKADQIIAGLAVWLLGLGAAPFAARILYGNVNTPSVQTFPDFGIPILKDIPFFGPVFFETGPMVLLLLVSVPLSWYVLNRTPYGRWIEAAGENPMALDTAGINVHRVRYSGVIISGVFSGLGGAALSLGNIGTFVGVGQTSVGGRGFIGLTAYLFANYNPIGAFGASLLFGSLDALQFRIQGIPGHSFPQYATQLVQLVPFVAIILVLAAVGRTQMPSEVGQHYDSGEE